jgi:hypothetical protein
VEETWRARAWVATETEADERREHARRIVGTVIVGVRYVTLDYRRSELARDVKGPRLVTDESEWLSPPWRYDDYDSVDFGVELTTTDGRTFSVTWDPLGDRESIGLRAEPLFGLRFDGDRDAAMWDVVDRSRWHTFTHTPVRSVELHYLPWGDEGQWCPRITLGFETRSIELLLGEGQSNDGIAPAADNVAVLYDPVDLPEWEQSHRAR